MGRGQEMRLVKNRLCTLRNKTWRVLNIVERRGQSVKRR